MINRNKHFFLLLAGTIIFDYFFWKEHFGLNILLMNVFIIIVILLLYPSAIRSKGAITTILGSLATAVAIVIHSSLFTIIVHISSLIVMVGFIHVQSLQSVLYAVPTSLGNYLMLPDRLASYIKSKRDSSAKMQRFLRLLKILIIPLVLLTIFYLMFRSGNLVFADLTNNMFASIGDWLAEVFSHLSFYRILFILWGAVMVGGLVYNNGLITFQQQEAALPEFIVRKRAEPVMSVQVKKLSMGLKNEIRAAIILMVLINLMLLVVNVIDIRWIWFGFVYTVNFDLRHFVHEGTYMLIASILLSMAVMMIYFRKNLNFYPNNNILKYLAYIWIVQNVLLLISVVIRNYHYIHYFGLAYKRIGVIIFLVLVLYGLYTLFIKISKKKSDYYLLRTNSWCLYVVLIFFSLVSWDTIITNHNLAHPLKNNMETSFLLTLSDKVLPEIDKHAYVLDQPLKYNSYTNFGSNTFHDVYESRVIKFMERKENESGLSWNWAEDEAYRYFKNKHKE